MIEAYVGVPGSGKSYMLVKRGLEALARGKRIYANFGFVRENVYHYLRRRHRLPHREAVLRADSIQEIRDYKDLLSVFEGLLLFDEAHMWFNAREYRLFPTEVLGFWSQHRKVGVDVLLATQRYGSVDTMIRDLVAHVWWARPAPLWLKLFLWPKHRWRLPVIRYTHILDDSLGIMQKRSSNIFEGVARNEVVVLDPLAAASYDTRAIFPPPIIELQKELDPKRRAAVEALGLAWDESKLAQHKTGPGPADGLPALTLAELAEAYRKQIPPHELLTKKLQPHPSPIPAVA